jgi:hypothetical protein
MAKMELRRYSGSYPSGSLQKKYIIEGSLIIRERTSQQAPSLALPFTRADVNILLNLLGQNKLITGNFIILPRTDDYTGGTGVPVSGFDGMRHQKFVIETDIFAPTGYHSIIDENGIETFGRITDIDIQRQGDDPVQDSVSFTFQVGIPLI